EESPGAKLARLRGREYAIDLAKAVEEKNIDHLTKLFDFEIKDDFRRGCFAIFRNSLAKDHAPETLDVWDIFILRVDATKVLGDTLQHWYAEMKRYGHGK